MQEWLEERLCWKKAYDKPYFQFEAINVFRINNKKLSQKAVWLKAHSENHP